MDRPRAPGCPAATALLGLGLLLLGAAPPLEDGEPPPAELSREPAAEPAATRPADEERWRGEERLLVRDSPSRALIGGVGLELRQPRPLLHPGLELFLLRPGRVLVDARLGVGWQPAGWGPGLDLLVGYPVEFPREESRPGRTLLLPDERSKPGWVIVPLLGVRTLLGWGPPKQERIGLETVAGRHDPYYSLALGVLFLTDSVLDGPETRARLRGLLLEGLFSPLAPTPETDSVGVWAEYQDSLQLGERRLLLRAGLGYEPCWGDAWKVSVTVPLLERP